MLGLAGTAPGGWENSEKVENRKRTMRSKEFIIIKGLKEITFMQNKKSCIFLSKLLIIF